MSFVYPSFLYAFLALSIPLIIHLFNFRRYKKVYFTNVAFLKDIESRSKNVKQLKRWIIFTLRTFALSCLILAFAQPFIPIGQSSAQIDGQSAAVIYIDNSLSMGQFRQERRLIDLAKDKAQNLANSLNSFDEIFLLSNDADPAYPLSKDLFRETLAELDLSNNALNWNQIVEQVKGVNLDGKYNFIRCFVISDFQKTQLPVMSEGLDKGDVLNLISIQAHGQENISLDSCWMNNAYPSIGEFDSLYIRIHNYAERDINQIPIKAHLNNKQVWLNSIDVPANGSAQIVMPLNHASYGDYAYRIEIGDQSNEFDNSLYLQYSIQEGRQVYLLSDNQYAPYFRALFQKPFQFDHDLNGNADLGFLNQSDCIIWIDSKAPSDGLKTRFRDAINEGKTVIVIPEFPIESNSFNELLEAISVHQFRQLDTAKTFIEKANIQSEALKGVITEHPENANLPFANNSYSLSETPLLSHEDILMFSEEKAALRKYTKQNGSVYLFAFGIDKTESNLMRHSLFVPLMLQLSRNQEQNPGLYYTLGKGGLIRLEGSENIEGIYNITGDESNYIPEVKKINGRDHILIGDQLKTDGIFSVESEDQLMRQFAINYDRTESNPESYDESSISSVLEENGISFQFYDGNSEQLIGQIRMENEATLLWKYCIILALLFFISEILVLKFMRQ